MTLSPDTQIKNQSYWGLRPSILPLTETPRHSINIYTEF